MNNNRPMIMVVDDEWMNREILQVYLENEGCDVVLAANGDQALDMIASQKPDLVLADVRMPRMSGFDLCAALKAEPVTQSLPVILVSGLEGEDERRRAMDAGADAFIGRPFDLPGLLKTINQLLGIA